MFLASCALCLNVVYKSRFTVYVWAGCLSLSLVSNEGSKQLATMHDRNLQLVNYVQLWF